MFCHRLALGYGPRRRGTRDLLEVDSPGLFGELRDHVNPGIEWIVADGVRSDFRIRVRIRTEQ